MMATRSAKQTKTRRKASSSTKKTAGKRERNKEQTKERILKAALELFGNKGFYQTTTKEISQKAKIAEGTLFNYFKSKEDLALYFFENEIQDCIDWYYRDNYIQRAPLAEKLFGITQRSLDRLAPYEEFIGAVYLRALQPKSKLHLLSLDAQALRVKELKFIRDILVEAEENREIPPVGDLGAYAVGLIYIGILTYWLNDKSEGKENTMAFLDRSLETAHRFLQGGNWEW
jgi:AcrR family transcriptional regulator